MEVRSTVQQTESVDRAAAKRVARRTRMGYEQRASSD